MVTPVDQGGLDDAATCPICGAKTLEIVYGMPSAQTFEAAERGELRLGGCMVFNDEPDRICTGSPGHYLLNGRFLGTEEYEDEEEEDDLGEG